MADIDLQGDAENESTWWNPIGYNKEKLNFEGIFDGNNFSIKNMYIEEQEENDAIVGLFSSIKNATIKNLTVGGNISIANGGAGGGIVGCSCGNCQIINCTNEAKVEKLATGREAAGIIGAILGESENPTTNGNVLLTNCINKGEIIGGNNCGGLVGCLYGTLTINDSHNEGIVTNLVGSYVGGLLGRDGNGTSNFVTINNSYNSGDITGKARTGGLIGRVGCGINVEVSIYNCYNKGNIINKNLSNYSVSGGLIGRAEIDVKNLKIVNSSNFKDIVILDETYNTILGGIIGQIYAENTDILNCCNIGNLEANWCSGIVGLIQHYGEIKPYINIKNSYNTGIITGKVYSSGIIRLHCSKEITEFESVYYLDTSASNGVYNQESTEGITASGQTYMQSQDFVNELNNNQKNIISDKPLKQWKYKEENYPTLFED